MNGALQNATPLLCGFHEELGPIVVDRLDTALGAAILFGCSKVREPRRRLVSFVSSKSRSTLSAATHTADDLATSLRVLSSFRLGLGADDPHPLCQGGCTAPASTPH